jgi:hypothetical protein
MPKRTRDIIPALVLAVLAKVYELSGGQTHPWYVDSSALDLIDGADSLDSLIYVAELSGWLVGVGEPPTIIAITAEGVRLLEACGLI